MSKYAIRLTTDRLLLREFLPDDWQAVLAYQSKPEYLRYYAWEQRTENDVQRFVQQFIGWQEERPRSKFQFAIVLPTEQELIGVCGIRMRTADSRKAELGYEIDPSHWGQGLATEAAQALLAFGFEKRHLHRIWAVCLHENKGSIRVLEKLGMRLEGRLRQNRFFKGRWWDTLIFGMLRGEWETRLA